MATKALRFYRATALPSTANSAKVGDIYFIKPSEEDGKIYVCTSLNSSNIPLFIKYADATVYTHPAVSRTNGTTTASPAHGTSFTAIDSITTNNQGHVTAVNTKTITLPAETVLNIVQNGTGYVSSVAKGTGSHDITVTRTALPTITVENGAAVSGNYISAISANGHTITVTKASLPSGSGGVSTTAGKYVSAVSLSGHTLTAGTTSFITDIANNGSSTTAPTTAAVKTYVDNKVASAIHIKGTIGSAGSGASVTALPTKDVIVGDAYIVKTAGTYSGIVCEVGDIIICTAASTSSAAPTWTTIQNNLDVATDVKLGTIKIGYSATGQNYPVKLDDNNKAYVNVPWIDTDTKVTSVANHYTPTANSDSQLSVDASSATAATWDSTSLVTGVNIQRDAKGHVTGVTVDSIKMPSNPNSHLTKYLKINGNGTEAVKFTQDADKTLNFAPGNNIGISAAAGTITINHAAITTSKGNDTKSLDYGGKFTYISSVSTDGYGHVTAYNTQEATLPARYSLPAATTTTLGGIKIGTSLEMSGEVCNVVWTDFGSNS